MAGFLGMWGTGDWQTNERPENWRQMILLLYPNGGAPLTAILSMMGSEQTDDPIFHWWTKKLADQGGSVTETYTDANLSSAASGAYAVGQVLYAKVAEALADEFKKNHVAMLSKDGDHNYNYRGEVVGVAKNGASSYVAVKLIEAATSTYDVGSTDNIDIVGSAHAEGAEMPDSIGYKPTEYSNFCQIFRTALSITDTARQTRLRTTDAYMERKRETLELHAIEMEKAFLFGQKLSTTGSNSKPKRFTQGLVPFIKANAPSGNVDDFRSAAGFGGQAWTATAGGKKWLDERLEQIFRFGSQDKLALAGTGAILGIQRLAETFADINIVPGQEDFGIKVLRWTTPFGVINIKSHPLFNNRTTLRNDMVITEPSLMRYRFVRNRDTRFIEDPRDSRNRNNSRDGTEEEFITECGLEVHHPEAHGYLTGLNKDNTSA